MTYWVTDENKNLIQVAGKYTLKEQRAFLMAHPIGSYYMSENSTSPAELYGGGWDVIAENVTISFGSSYGVTYNANGQAVKFLKTDGSHAFYNNTTTLKGANVDNVDPVLNIQLDVNAGYNFNAIINPNGTLVANASSYMSGLYIWKRYQ